MLKKILNGVAAGICISLGGSVFLACENRYVGAVMFSVALLCICLKGYSLYTGRIGFIPMNHKKEDFSVLLLGLLGNAIGTIVGGYLIRTGISSLGDSAQLICETKLTQSFASTLVRGIMCGVLMYLAVSIFRDGKNITGIVFCIPVFILSGFEHSIADIFYFAASGIVSVKALGFCWTVILGNTVGALILPCITDILNKEKTDG